MPLLKDYVIKDAERITEAARLRLEELEVVASTLNLHHSRRTQFIAKAFLDFYVTQISVRELAEFREYRKNGF